MFVVSFKGQAPSTPQLLPSTCSLWFKVLLQEQQQPKTFSQIVYQITRFRALSSPPSRALRLSEQIVLQ